MKDKIITLGHGSGAALTQQLIKEVFGNVFGISSYDDAVEINNRTVVTTDAYVIKPLFFPGGDIGSLSVNGTVNDLSMSGSKPAFLLASFILEEGFPINDLKKIVSSMQAAALEAGIKIIAGDTKVVEKNKCDGIYITTTGVGYLAPDINLTLKNIKQDDVVIINGTIGDHTIAIINARENLNLEPVPKTDCAPLTGIVNILLQHTDLKFARDATRGGVATILNEIANERGLGIIINEESLPVKDSTKAICGLLGLDPMYLANEGKLIAFISPHNSEETVRKIRNHKYGTDANVIGYVTSDVKGVYLKTSIGSLRPLPLLASDPLPRIC